MDTQPWHGADIVALDLEGSGAQDRHTEAILEIAAVPLTHGKPDLDRAFTTLVNPRRPIPRRPWISPGLTDAALAHAPTLEQIAPTLAQMLDGRWVLGHNTHVDWRLLNRHLPTLRPAGLLDTLHLARAANLPDRTLSALVDSMQLRDAIQTAAQGSQPHRALCDTVATAHLLPKLIHRLWPNKPPTFDSLRLAARIPLDLAPADEPSLFD